MVLVESDGVVDLRSQICKVKRVNISKSKSETPSGPRRGGCSVEKENVTKDNFLSVKKVGCSITPTFVTLLSQNVI